MNLDTLARESPLTGDAATSTTLKSNTAGGEHHKPNATVFPDGRRPSMVPRYELTKELSLTSDESSVRTSVATSWRHDEVNRARQHVERIFRNSRLEDRTLVLPKFTDDECLLGRFLGEGAFGKVHEVRHFFLNSSPQLQSNALSQVMIGDESDPDREFIAKTCTLGTGEARYAIKRLRSAVIDDRMLYGQGVANMVMEARMLSSVHHPHIIKVHAVSACDPYRQPGFFLIMDRLCDTLEHRLTKWQHRHRRASLLFGALDRHEKKKSALLEERLVAASGLSSALEYLHSKGIIHRDLKPENIGFDMSGDVKLFDFSIAASLHSRVANPDGTYNLTGMTGSLRYMAPEVALEQPYNATCDVYSFAILFWEMYTMKKPFGLLTSSVFFKFVVNGETRPLIPDSWSIPLTIMSKRCWSKNIDERLTMKDISSILTTEMARVRADALRVDGDNDLTGSRARKRKFFFYDGLFPSKKPAFWTG